MFKIIDFTKRELIAIDVEGKLTKADYDKITPLIDKAVKDFGKVKLYIQLNNLDGIAPGAFWEDVKTYLKHFNHMKKIAVIGKNYWEKLWSGVAEPFVKGEIKYFDFSDSVKAREWIQQ